MMASARHVLRAAASLAALAVGSQALIACAERESVTDSNVDVIFSTSSPSASYFPFYVADANGYYEDLGLTVEFSYSTGSSSAIQQLASGHSDYAVVTPDSVLTAASQNIEVVYAYEHFYENRFGVVVPEDSSVESIADLDGKSIGVSEAAGGEVPTVRAAISSAGLTEGEDIDIVSVGGGTSALKALKEGKVAALGVSKPDLVALQSTGAKLRYVTPEELVELPGDGLAIRPDSLSGQAQEQLAKFLDATREAWRWSTANPDEAYDIVKSSYAQEQLANDSYGRPFFKINLDDTTPTAGVQQGRVDIAAFDRYMELLVDLDILEAPVDVEQITSNEAFDLAAAGSEGDEGNTP